MQHSPSIANLAKALIGFRKQVGKIEFNQEYTTTDSEGNPKIYRYADLAQVKNKSEEALLANGLVVSQPLGDSALTTMLMHESGEYMSDTVSLGLVSKRGVQEYGAIITYLRRYSYCSMLGLVSEEDSDAANVDNKVKPEQVSNKREVPKVKSKGNTLPALNKLKKRGESVKTGTEILVPQVASVDKKTGQRDGKNANFIVAFINKYSVNPIKFEGDFEGDYLGTMDFALRAPTEQVSVYMKSLIAKPQEGVDEQS